MPAKSTKADFTICGHSVPAGSQFSFDLDVPDLYVYNELSTPIKVINGKREGPVLFISGSIHGDEIMGVEIIRRVLAARQLKSLSGTLVVAPVVNIFGFLNQSRYLPDRRDLNRSFPGTTTGSIAGRLANLFLKEIVELCTHGIDLHTAAVNRENLPQIRANTKDPEVEQMARAFGLPVIVSSTKLIEGSLRESAANAGVKIIVYEAGEALRFDETAIRAGVSGVLGVMRDLDMLRKTPEKPAGKRGMKAQAVTRSSKWVRAPQSGIHRSITRLGAVVTEGDHLGYIAHPFGDNELPVKATTDGVIIGRSNIPLVTEGEALFHIASFAESSDMVGEEIDKVEARLDEGISTSEFDEPPIV